MTKFLHPIDLAKNELQNARVQNLASDPSSPVEGQIYYNTTDDELRYWDSTAWVPLTESAASVEANILTGSPTAASSSLPSM